MKLNSQKGPTIQLTKNFYRITSTLSSKSDSNAAMTARSRTLTSAGSARTWSQSRRWRSPILRRKSESFYKTGLKSIPTTPRAPCFTDSSCRQCYLTRKLRYYSLNLIELGFSRQTELSRVSTAARRRLLSLQSLTASLQDTFTVFQRQAQFLCLELRIFS